MRVVLVIEHPPKMGEGIHSIPEANQKPYASLSGHRLFL